MKTKFLIPALAAIFAIGMSFTTVDLDNQAQDYVHLGGDSWQSIAEQNCGNGEDACRVQFGSNGPIYKVYDERNLNSIKPSPKDSEPIVINP